MNTLSHDAVLAAIPAQCPENYGLTDQGVITGFAFGCVKHSKKIEDTEPRDIF